MAESDANAVDGGIDVGRLYAAQAGRVRRLVRLDSQAPEALIEDACQVAWARLLLRRSSVTPEGAVRWLIQVARHELWRQTARIERDLALEVLADPPLTAPDLVEAMVDRRRRVSGVNDLPARQQEVMWLIALGFSYAEVAARTGLSRRTVERQLQRARARLRAEAAA